MIDTLSRQNGVGPAEGGSAVKRRLDELIGNLRSGIEEFEEPRAKALFEMAAEALQVFQKYYEVLEPGAEPAIGMKLVAGRVIHWPARVPHRSRLPPSRSRTRGPRTDQTL